MRVQPFGQVLATASPSAPGRMLFGLGATPSTGATPINGVGPAIIAFCSDEDVARRAGADYVALAGDSQMLARGLDGQFPDPSGSPWTMASASVDFGAQGVQAGDVLHLIEPKMINGSPTWPSKGQLLAVDSVSGPAVTLRRIGLSSGLGDPPVPPAGYPAGCKFQVATLYPQIIDASRDLRQVYGLDDRIWGRRTGDLYDLLQFVEPCVYKLLYLRYLDQARSAGNDKDDFAKKSSSYQDQYQTTIDRLAIHFTPSPMPIPEVTRFSTRIVR